MPSLLSQVVFVYKRQSPGERSPELMLNLSGSSYLYLSLFLRFLGWGSEPPQFHNEAPQSCRSRGESLKPGKVLAWVGFLKGLVALEELCVSSLPRQKAVKTKEKGVEADTSQHKLERAIFHFIRLSDEQLLLFISWTNTLLINTFSPTCYVNIDVWLNTTTYHFSGGFFLSI